MNKLLLHFYSFLYNQLCVTRQNNFNMFFIIFLLNSFNQALIFQFFQRSRHMRLG